MAESNVPLVLHLVTLLLVYAYIKEQLAFHFLLALLPSLLVYSAEFYHQATHSRGLQRTRIVVTWVVLMAFVLCMCQVVKNEGGMHGGRDDGKWLVRHRKSMMLLPLAILVHILYRLIDKRNDSQQPSLVQHLLLNVFSALSMPISVCSGGACHSIYLSTVTSILSSFSLPLTLVVPILNYLAWGLQCLALFSIYSVAKWRNPFFWLFLAGMLLQSMLGWMSCVVMGGAVLLNARQNTFRFGKHHLFKQSIV